jgi:phospholipid N-methyltransferase
MTKQEILQQCTVQGNIVKLPPINLERKLYQDVAKALELTGGKWKGGKVAGFVFDEDPTELLAQIANGESRNLKKEFQFFPTPAKLAAQMAKIANIKKGDKILEPSAGQGAIVKAIMAEYPFVSSVDCCELMGVNKTFLAKIKGVNILADDFLTLNQNGQYTDYYDVIVANPPFAKNQDIDHVKAMFEVLKPDGRLVVIVSPHYQISNNKKETEFRGWLNTINARIEEIQAGAFSESGTAIKTMLLTINKPTKQTKIMTYRQKYDSIDRNEIPEKMAMQLETIYQDTEGFANKEAIGYYAKSMDSIYNAIKENLPEAITALPHRPYVSPRGGRATAVTKNTGKAGSGMRMVANKPNVENAMPEAIKEQSKAKGKNPKKEVDKYSGANAVSNFAYLTSKKGRCSEEINQHIENKLTEIKNYDGGIWKFAKDKNAMDDLSLFVSYVREYIKAEPQAIQKPSRPHRPYVAPRGSRISLSKNTVKAGSGMRMVAPKAAPKYDRSAPMTNQSSPTNDETLLITTVKSVFLSAKHITGNTFLIQNTANSEKYYTKIANKNGLSISNFEFRNDLTDLYDFYFDAAFKNAVEKSSSAPKYDRTAPMTNSSTPNFDYIEEKGLSGRTAIQTGQEYGDGEQYESIEEIPFGYVEAFKILGRKANSDDQIVVEDRLGQKINMYISDMYISNSSYFYDYKDYIEETKNNRNNAKPKTKISQAKRDKLSSAQEQEKFDIEEKIDINTKAGLKKDANRLKKPKATKRADPKPQLTANEKAQIALQKRADQKSKQADKDDAERAKKQADKEKKAAANKKKADSDSKKTTDKNAKLQAQIDKLRAENTKLYAQLKGDNEVKAKIRKAIKSHLDSDNRYSRGVGALPTMQQRIEALKEEQRLLKEQLSKNSRGMNTIARNVGLVDAKSAQSTRKPTKREQKAQDTQSKARAANVPMVRRQSDIDLIKSQYPSGKDKGGVFVTVLNRNYERIKMYFKAKGDNKLHLTDTEYKLLLQQAKIKAQG